MKKCPYCGKEYPDSATVCEIDANPLVAKGANAALSPKVKMTGLDKAFADSSRISFGGLYNALLWSFIGAFACKHPTARKNARIYFVRRIVLIVVIVLAVIIILLIKGAWSK